MNEELNIAIKKLLCKIGLIALEEVNANPSDDIATKMGARINTPQWVLTKLGYGLESFDGMVEYSENYEEEIKFIEDCLKYMKVLASNVSIPEEDISSKELHE